MHTQYSKILFIVRR